MPRAATTLADPCTGAPRRDFLLGLHRGQPVRAQVPSWCSRHRVGAGCSQRAGPPGQLTTHGDQTPGGYRRVQEGTGWVQATTVYRSSPAGLLGPDASLTTREPLVD